MTPGAKLRELMKNGIVAAPFVIDGLQAILAQQAGRQAVYMTGFGAASTLGLPDVGLMTVDQMVNKLRAITSTSIIPVIADADTGYGNYINVIQTVREYENAGAAALHIEDQVWPKRCGYMLNKQVIDKQEAVMKIKAAVDARKDEGLVIIARTDALAVGGWHEVEDRIGAYMEAGADMGFVDGIKDLEDMREYAKRLSGVPTLLNNVPMMPMKEVEKFGDFKIMLNPFPMASAWLAYRAALKHDLISSRYLSWLPARLQSKKKPGKESGFNQIINALGAQEYFEMDKKYGSK